MKHINDKQLAFIVAFLTLLMGVCIKCHAGEYEYKGVFPVQSVMTNICENCYLQFPPEYLKSEIVLSIDTDDTTKVFKALQAASEAIGWQLSKRGGKYKVEPLQNVGSLVYISCMTDEPVNVPQYLYQAALKSDSVKCAKRDSLKQLQDSLVQAEKHRQDSIKALRLPFQSYELRYYSYTKNFSDKLGVEFSGILAKGNFHDKFKIFDDWQLFATQTNDTSFTNRMVTVSFDSTLSLDWGTEEQTLKTTYVTSNGVVNSDYEWRKYGLIISLKKDSKKTYMSYVFRDKEQNISVLQGSAVADNGDTLRVTGEYTTSRQVRTGVPFLSSIPAIGLLFSTEQTLTDVKRFELYLVPLDNQKAVQDDRQVQGTISTAATDTTASGKL